MESERHWKSDDVWKKVRPFLVSVRELNFLRKRQWDNRLHSTKNTMDAAYGRARSDDLRMCLKRE